MRSLAFLISGVVLFFSCTNEESGEHKNKDSEKEEEEVSTPKTDSLPELKWNGEYLQIEDGDEPKIKRKSQGSDFYSMGNVNIKIGNDHVEFKLFERKRNVLSFTNGSITAFIQSAFNEDIHLVFKKSDIILKHQGKYKADPSGKAINSVKMSIKSGEKGKQKEYTLESGEVELIHFSPRLALLELKIKGTFSTKDGTKEKGEGTLKMNFEQAVMTAQ